MKRLLYLIFLTPTLLIGQIVNIDDLTIDKYKSHDLSSINNLQDLTKNISQLTSNKKEQLQILLLWTHQNMNADTIRFFKGGNPLTTSEAIKKRIGLCDEYSNIINDFCETLKIPCIRIEGYVKYINFKPGDKFEEANHAWNAVYIDSTWTLCDLFWSTQILKSNDSISQHFFKKINTNYFLSPPNNFIVNHLPCDPTFQFDNHPIRINAFTNLIEGLDSTVERILYFNYTDTIKTLMKLNNNDRVLRIALHSYNYNENNPNILIIESYNYGVLVVNNKTASKSELKKGKDYFTLAIKLIDKSNKSDIKELKGNCQQGINAINRRLSVP